MAGDAASSRGGCSRSPTRTAERRPLAHSWPAAASDLGRRRRCPGAEPGRRPPPAVIRQAGHRRRPRKPSARAGDRAGIGRHRPGARTQATGLPDARRGRLASRHGRVPRPRRGCRACGSTADRGERLRARLGGTTAPGSAAAALTAATRPEKEKERRKEEREGEEATASSWTPAEGVMTARIHRGQSEQIGRRKELRLPPSLSLYMPQAEHLSPPQMLPPALRHAPLPSAPSLPLSVRAPVRALPHEEDQDELMSAQPRHSAQ